MKRRPDCQNGIAKVRRLLRKTTEELNIAKQLMEMAKEAMKRQFNKER